ncbi:DUF3341 domain-containing protein [Methylocystis sp. B8]|uniref:DUF3341 domain-containing protein n=1 Tax=Methylocystis sp. B8 TaxID=544938 RepID=UPI0010FD3925|nr:DUF3341 domain-containing protein [Methylocystis sp. B8]TLG73700.1 DUF3341 domain-containing protein [Methylocystis sp. B8]
MSRSFEAQAASKGLTGSFISEEASLAALSSLNAAGVGEVTLFSPVPPNEAPKPSRLPAVALVMGLLGAAAFFTLQSFANVIAYPLDIGGRPPFSWPSFIPIAFEAGILSVVLTAVIGAGALCGLPRYYDPVDETPMIRDSSIDRWVVVVRARDWDALARSQAILQDCGARAIEEAEL